MLTHIGAVILAAAVLSPGGENVGGIFQRRVTGSCEEGSAIRAIEADGSVTCEPDDDTTGPSYRPGPGIEIAGDVISLATSGCSAGEVWTYDGTTFRCAPAPAPGVFQVGSARYRDATELGDRAWHRLNGMEVSLVTTAPSILDLTAMVQVDGPRDLNSQVAISVNGERQEDSLAVADLAVTRAGTVTLTSAAVLTVPPGRHRIAVELKTNGDDVQRGNLIVRSYPAQAQ